MKPVLILFATREGHTQRIAGYLAAAARKRGLSAETRNVAEIPAGFSLDAYSTAIVAASVHAQKHEKEMIAFVKRHTPELGRIPAIFLSVSLTEAGAENPGATPEVRQKAAADVETMIRSFLAQTGWHPAKIQAVAGALMYSKYNWLMRFMMKQIARKSGGSTDTTRDHEYTDWAALDRLVDELAVGVPS